MPKHRYIPIYHDPELTLLIKQGMTPADIAATMNFSPETIAIRMAYLDLQPATRPKRRPKEPPANPDDISPEASYLALAIRATGAFLKNDAYWFPSGEPASTGEIVRRYNRMLKRDHKAQVGPDIWRVS